MLSIQNVSSVDYKSWNITNWQIISKLMLVILCYSNLLEAKLLFTFEFNG